MDHNGTYLEPVDRDAAQTSLMTQAINRAPITSPRALSIVPSKRSSRKSSWTNPYVQGYVFSTLLDLQD